MKKRVILGIEVDDSVYEYSERDEVGDAKIYNSKKKLV